MEISTKKTILLVEDEALIAMAEAHTIGGFGYQVLTARSGERAVEMVTGNGRQGGEQPIDLILMDIDLGRGIDGTEAARRILALREIPIVFLTSHSEKEYVDRVREITRYGYVIKNSGEFVLRSSIEMAFELFEAHTSTREREEQLSTTLSSIGDAVIATDRHGRVTLMNAIAEKLTGWLNDEARNRPLTEIFNIVNAFSRQPCENPAEQVLVSGTVIGLANHTVLIARDGTEYHIADSAAPIYGGDRSIRGVVLVFRDVSDEYRMQEALRKSEADLRDSHRIAQMGRWELDIVHDTLHWSDGTYAIFEIDPNKFQATYQAFIDTVHPEDRSRVDQAYTDSLRTGEPYEISHRLLMKDGRIKWMHEICRTEYDPNGKPLRSIGIVQDITEQTQAAQAVFDERERLDGILSSLNTGLSLINPDLSISWVNRKIREMFPGREPVGEHCYRFYHGRQSPCASCSTIASFECGEIREMEQRRSNDHRSFRITSQPLKDASGKVVTVLEGVTDITEQVHTEESLREREEEFRSLAESSGDYIMRYDRQFRHSYMNSAGLEVSGLSAADIIGKTHRESGFPEEQCRFWEEKILHVFETGEPYRTEFEWESARGPVVLDWRLTPEWGEDGSVKSVLGVSRDITERKRAEDRIRDLLSEKELLLHEVHHRIKNNMNTMASLLSLQSTMVKDESAATALKDAERRLKSMEVLYDRLYRSENMKEMSVSEYLPPLISDIVRSFPRREGIETGMRIEDFLLEAKQLSVIGIILNELITNSMKHAFVGRSSGRLTVSASAMQDDTIRITVEDNGNGIPDSVDMNSSEGFGLHLIRMLMEQIDGTIRIERTEGTRFILSFTRQAGTVRT